MAPPPGTPIRVASLVAGLFALCGPAACGGSSSRNETPPAAPVRLTDLWSPERLSQAPGEDPEPTPRTEWRFDEADAPSEWQAGPGIADLSVRDGALRGRTSEGNALLHAERTSQLAPDDAVHAVEIRGRVSAGKRIDVRFQTDVEPGLPKARRGVGAPGWGTMLEIEAGDEVQTWRLPAPVFSSARASDALHVIVRPTDAADAEFAFESIRVVFQSEHLAELESGRGWHGLRDVYHDSLLLRDGERARFDVVVPRGGRLDLELGTPANGPVTFGVDLTLDGATRRVVERTLTTPYRWERASADLSAHAGRSATLTLSVASGRPGAIGFFGAPALRARHDPAGQSPQGVIVFLGDTLRRHHLDAYGYPRETAPTLTRLASEGAIFLDPIAQGSWTKVSTPSILTGLYQSSHGVKRFPDRLSHRATTLAEIFRDAGYATLAYSSVPFTGRFSNMHQGYETLYEAPSVRAALVDMQVKTARAYVDRLLQWLEDHPGTPFFVFLQAMDPHDPFEPRAPWAAQWADPARRPAHLGEVERARPHIAHGFMRSRGLANADELRAAGVEPQPHLDYHRDWYDGSIRGMDAELSRLVERLGALGIDDVLLVFTSDHGEEFGEHGEVFHGQSLYAEMIEVPLVFWGPGRVPEGVRVEETVRSIDILPTVLELSGLPPAQGVQGRSLVPALRGESLEPALAFSEKWTLPDSQDVRRQRVESFAVVDARWKLVHNTRRPDDLPEFELFDRAADPGETRNLADAHPEVVSRLRSELDAWRQQVASVSFTGDETQGGEASAEELEALRALGYVE